MEKDSIILSVGEKDEVSIGEVVKEIGNAYGYDDIVFDASYSDGQYKKTADNGKLMRLYGDYEFMSVKDGTKKSVEWFIENYEECRK